MVSLHHGPSAKIYKMDPNGNLCLRPLTQQNPTIHVAFMLMGSCTMPHVFGVRQTAKLLAGREQVRLFKGSHWLQNKTATWTNFSENISKHSKKNDEKWISPWTVSTCATQFPWICQAYWIGEWNASRSVRISTKFDYHLLHIPTFYPAFQLPYRIAQSAGTGKYRSKWTW